jgi:hypothetical protein
MNQSIAILVTKEIMTREETKWRNNHVRKTVVLIKDTYPSHSMLSKITNHFGYNCDNS